MLVEQLLADDYVFEVVIAQVLKASAQRLLDGRGGALAERFGSENVFLSVALLLHDVFAFAPNAFVARLLSEDSTDRAETEMMVVVCVICLGCGGGVGAWFWTEMRAEDKCRWMKQKKQELTHARKQSGWNLQEMWRN